VRLNYLPQSRTKMTLANTDKAMRWLTRFEKGDQSDARDLINSILEVSYHDFMNGLTELILVRSKCGAGPIGLYAERQIKAWRGIPNRLFKEGRSKPRKATGTGVQKVFSIRAYAPEVGSEGIVEQLITELCRQHPKLFINHPGPDRIRKYRVRRFFLITDLIGSGEQASKYLQSAWRVHSVRSWYSLKLLKFEVLAYSAIDAGQRRVRKHACQPDVYYVQSCPTIESSFPRVVAQRIRELCSRYDPVSHDPVESLGHRGSGALLVFAHGAPNNSPRLFHKGSKRWAPLFPSRVTASFRAKFARDVSVKALSARLGRMGQARLSKSIYLAATHPDARLLLLVLSALARGPRFDEALSQRTRLTIPEISSLIGKAQSLAWIDDRRHLTDEGRRQLDHARRWRPAQPAVVFAVDEPYYPQQLRAPQPPS
jgi:hypothetical protein